MKTLQLEVEDLFAGPVFPLDSAPVKNTKQRIVQEAAALMGRRELAGRLGMSMVDIASWIGGNG